MRKRLLASMIAMVLLLSLFPVSALVVERDKGSETPVACAVTEGCTLQALGMSVSASCPMNRRPRRMIPPPLTM